MRKLKFWLPTAMLAVLLSGCDNGDSKVVPTSAPTPVVNQQPQAAQPQVVYEDTQPQQPQVVVVQQPPQVVYRDSYHHSVLHDVAAGVILHHALTGGFSSRRPAVVNHYHYSAPRRSFSSRGRRR